jgi:hypothetical protein
LPPLLLLQVDTLMMKHFLSAFSDEDCALILKHCRWELMSAATLHHEYQDKLMPCAA